MSDIMSVEKPRSAYQEQKGPLGVTRRLAIGVAGIIVICLVISRFVAESRMMRAHGNDAQMAIWWIESFVQVVFWLVTGGGVAALMIWLWHRKLASIVCFAVFLLWIGAVSWSAWTYASGASALEDASNPSTSSQRLHELVEFRGIKAGYQLDNFLAANPNTATEDLRALAFRKHQSGTDMLLAANPNTPVDLLEKFFATHDAYIWNGLARNPKLPESIEKELAKSTDPAIRYLLEHRGAGQN